MQKLVVVDPGHDDKKDPGAVDKVRGIKEAKINWNVAGFLVDILKANGIQAMLTHQINAPLDINARARVANTLGANLLVSVHHNAGGGHGWEIIHSIHGGTGEKLAHLIGQEFTALGQQQHGKGIYSKATQDGKRDYFGVIRETNCPAIITEFAYMDSDDINDVDTFTEQKAEARAIAKGICSLWGIQFKEVA